MGADVAARWTRKDFVGIEALAPDELRFVLDEAKQQKEILLGRAELAWPLAGKTVLNLFVEPSTRTRIAFEMAAQKLGAAVINVDKDASSFTKGESLRDAARNLEALQADMIVIRHSSAGAAHYLSHILEVPVINGGDGAHEHPTQALLDVFTLLEHWGSLEGRCVTILGDILFSRVARSNIWALTKLGARVILAGPSTLVPEVFASFDENVTVTHDLQEALAPADAVMLLRIQHERQSSTHFPSLGEYTALFGLNQERLGWLKPDALIMHPGPINRGVELDDLLADSERSVVLQQVTNGVACRMAVLKLCYEASQEEAS